MPQLVESCGIFFFCFILYCLCFSLPLQKIKIVIMRVLIVNTSERAGGAAVAANRLMDALNNNGVKAKMLVRSGSATFLAFPVEFLVGTMVHLLASPFLAQEPLWHRHRQYRFRHHFLARVQGGGCHPFALDQPRYVVAQEYPKDYQQR